MEKILIKTSRPQRCLTLALFCVIGLMPLAALAQGTSGSLQGTVTDASGALVPGVTVTAREQSTGFLFSAKSNSAGIFLIGQMRPGVYEVSAKKSGYAEFVQRGITLSVNDQLTLNIKMAVGSVTQKVQVSSEAPLLQTNAPTVGKVIDQRKVEQLPLNGRNPVNLVLLTPGTQETTVSNGTSGDKQPRLSGGRMRTGEYLLDGTSITDPRRGDTVLYPNLDAIQEMSVLTNGIPAEYGRLAGGIVVMSMKTGTNHFHGNLFEFYRGSGLAAKNYFSTSVPQNVYNQFGGIVGGPIKRNKIFFFGDFQETRQASQAFTNRTVPTEQELHGDFSQILGAKVGLDALGRPIYKNEIFDPATTRLAPNGKQVRDPFPGNIIPSGRFDPSGYKVAQLFPAPTRPGLVQNFYALETGGVVNIEQFDVRVDSQLTQRDLLFARVSANLDHQPTKVIPGFPAAQGSLGTDNDFYTSALGWTHTISPTILNDFHFGQLRGELDRHLANTSFADLGIPNLPQVNLPSFQVPGYTNFGSSAPFDPTEEEYQIADQATLVRGRHIITVGMDFRRFRINDLQLTANGTFSMSKNQTSSPSSGSTGDPVASLLLGAVDKYSNDPNRSRFYLRSNYFGAFIQDEFKVTRNFTADLGIRYDVEQNPNETKWNGSNFDLESGQVLTMRQLGRNRIQATNFDNFSPRIGFAWKPWGDSTVVRSSYGIFFTPLTGRATSAYNRFPKSQPFTLQSSELNPAAIISQTPPSPINTNGYNEDQPYTLAQAPSGYFQQWSLDIQKELGRNFLGQAAYTGSVGNHLATNREFNQIPISLVQQNGGGTQALRPYFHFTDILCHCPSQHSSYHALELSLEKRYSSGFEFLASYTWSKFIDEQDDDFSQLIPQDAYNTKAEKGLSLANVPQIFALSGIYNLPFGRGRQHLRDGILSTIVGGWQGAGILHMQSGQQVWIHSANNTSQAFGGSFRPNQVGDPLLHSGRTLNHWFNTDAFAAPPPLTFGDSRKTPGIQGPGWVNFDFNLNRSIHLPITEATKLELRGECFNCFNHPNFEPPEAQFGTSTFGRITSAESGRVIQIAGKLWF